MVSRRREEINFFVHRGKAIARDSHTMSSKITSLNLSENINIFPIKNQSQNEDEHFAVHLLF